MKTFEAEVEPEHGARTICLTCGRPITYIRHEQYAGDHYETLDAWWVHDEHPTDDHDAQPMTEAAHLSRLLFSAREQIEMWADVVEKQTHQEARSVRRLIAEIDTYRAERGWSPDGFGGEHG